MEIIPAIDIIDGKCVRLTKGRFSEKKVYNEDPLAVAEQFQAAGFQKVHVIDLEGAQKGTITNWDTIRALAENTDLSLEFGGGIQGEDDITKLLALGIDKIILGSLVVQEPHISETLLKRFPNAIIVGVDVKDDSVYYRGWQKAAAHKLLPFVQQFVRWGVTSIECTDITADGTLQGPNLVLYQKLVRAFPRLNIIAAGGVRNTHDLKQLAATGVTGAIIGKALYEHTITPEDLRSLDTG